MTKFDSREEIINKINEELKEHQKDGLNFLQSVSRVFVEYEAMRERFEEYEKNVLTTLSVLCEEKGCQHAEVIGRMEEIKVRKEEKEEIKKEIANHSNKIKK